jgi:hypothetical protein
VLRIVCRNGFSRDLAEAFLIDLRSALVDLRADGGSATGKVGFHH